MKFESKLFCTKYNVLISWTRLIFLKSPKLSKNFKEKGIKLYLTK